MSVKYHVMEGRSVTLVNTERWRGTHTEQVNVGSQITSVKHSYITIFEWHRRKRMLSDRYTICYGWMTVTDFW
jgi:hypothetical protein